MLTHEFNGQLKRFVIQRDDALVILTVRRGPQGHPPGMSVDLCEHVGEFAVKREDSQTFLLIHRNRNKPTSYLLITADYKASEHGPEPTILVKFRADLDWKITWPDQPPRPRREHR